MICDWQVTSITAPAAVSSHFGSQTQLEDSRFYPPPLAAQRGTNTQTQVNFNTSGKANYLGDFTGPLTRLQDNQGNFGSTAVIVGANGKDSVFFSVSGRFEHSKDKCVVTSTGIYTVTGGAGAFANATGGGTIVTQFDLCASTATGTYAGTISRPNSN